MQQMDRPLVSVVVPVFQAEKTLNACVDSILAQTYSEIEVILIDDGSTDNSALICDQYAQIDTRVHVIHQKNGGVSSARNAGMLEAFGEYILFVDSDDSILPDMLKSLMDLAITGNCDAVVSGLIVRQENAESRMRAAKQSGCFGSEIWNQICIESEPFGWAGGKLLRKRIVREHNLCFNTAMRSQEDLDFLLSVYEHCACICVTSYAGYMYDYAPRRKNPPVWDFIANQLKLNRIAQEKTVLTPEAKRAVQDRILLLLYTLLYDACDHGWYDEALGKLKAVHGLKDYLRGISASGEKAWIAAWYAKGAYGRIRRYLIVRNRIRDLVRKLRGR